jgi:maltose/moltooligosaccharide transporter
MMIVIPMILQTTSFGFVLEHFLDNDPGKAIGFGGVLLLLAFGATLLIKETKAPAETVGLSGGGH